MGDMKVKVRICGPNLRDQSKGDFHVHADGCADLAKYGPGRRNGGDRYGEREMLVEVSTKYEVAEAIYSDHACDDNEYGSRDYVEYLESAVADFHYAPCVKGVK